MRARNPHIDAPLSVEIVEVIVRYEPGVFGMTNGKRRQRDAKIS